MSAAVIARETRDDVQATGPLPRGTRRCGSGIRPPTPRYQATAVERGGKRGRAAGQGRCTRGHSSRAQAAEPCDIRSRAQAAEPCDIRSRAQAGFKRRQGPAGPRTGPHGKWSNMRPTLAAWRTGRSRVRASSVAARQGQGCRRLSADARVGLCPQAARPRYTDPKAALSCQAPSPCDDAASTRGTPGCRRRRSRPSRTRSDRRSRQLNGRRRRCEAAVRGGRASGPRRLGGHAAATRPGCMDPSHCLTASLTHRPRQYRSARCTRPPPPPPL